MDTWESSRLEHRIKNGSDVSSQSGLFNSMCKVHMERGYRKSPHLSEDSPFKWIYEHLLLTITDKAQTPRPSCGKCESALGHVGPRCSHLGG